MLTERTLVTCDGGAVVGTARVRPSRVHPGRLPCVIEVSETHRRRGIGRGLLATVRGLGPDLPPLSCKVPPGSPGALFATAVGGSVYQRCPGARVDLRNPRLLEWCAAARPAPDAEPRSLVHVPPHDLAVAFTEQYLWVHEDWSPVGSRAALDEAAATTVAEADPASSTGAWVDGRLAAVAFSFPAGGGLVEIVAETQFRDEPDGLRLLASVVARCLSVAADAGHATVEFDGHVTDPHLAPVLDSMPLSDTRPILLMEIPYGGS